MRLPIRSLSAAQEEISSTLLSSPARSLDAASRIVRGMVLGESCSSASLLRAPPYVALWMIHVVQSIHLSCNEAISNNLS